MTTQTKQAARAFAAALASSLAKSLTEAVKEAIHIKVVDTPGPATSHTQLVQFRLSAEGGLRGECVVEFTEVQVAELGSKILGTLSASFSDAHAEAFRKVLASAMENFASHLAAEHGGVSFKVDRALSPTLDKTQLVALTTSDADKVDVPASLYLDRQLTESLNAPKSAASHAPAGSSIESGNLNLVMDVELNVSLRFGQRQLPLREVLELASGSVIELDCQVDEPIDLLLDGKVIARGEAVIIDGNYGLRVTEIPQPMASHFSR